MGGLCDHREGSQIDAVFQAGGYKTEGGFWRGGGFPRGGVFLKTVPLGQPPTNSIP